MVGIRLKNSKTISINLITEFRLCQNQTKNSLKLVYQRLRHLQKTQDIISTSLKTLIPFQTLRKKTSKMVIKLISKIVKCKIKLIQKK